MPETRTPRPWACASLIALVPFALGACGSGEDSAPTEWRAAARADLSDAQTTLLDRFVDARNELASSLFAELSGAIKASGHPEAIGVCQDRAPAIAQEVSAKHGVRIGRTSAKLRNPGNKAPSWAAGLIQSDANEQFLARGDDDLRGLFPIVIAAPCLACHGQADSLADGVAEALSKRYATDEATGYSEGDLRGWFWVESGLE